MKLLNHYHKNFYISLISKQSCFFFNEIIFKKTVIRLEIHESKLNVFQNSNPKELN